MVARGLVIVALAVLAAIAGALPAMAQGFPPRVYRDARLKSEFHLQIAIERVRVPSPTPGICIVNGKIVRVFRGNVALDTPIELELDCKKESDVVRPGQTLWTDADKLAAGHYLEAFVNRGPYGFQHSLWQFAIIPEATDRPTIEP
ncbi:hypothetical protein STVA_54530 [Allostella vacuolata]|nr:hypothetical protein STVA_54530 [Stella vacuolata]